MGAELSHVEQRFENFPIGKFFRDSLTRRPASLRAMTLGATVGRSPSRCNVRLRARAAGGASPWKPLFGGTYI